MPFWIISLVVEDEVQVIPARELLIQWEVKELNKGIKELQVDHDYWDSKEEGSGKDLLECYRKSVLEWITG